MPYPPSGRGFLAGGEEPSRKSFVTKSIQSPAAALSASHLVEDIVGQQIWQVYLLRHHAMRGLYHVIDLY